MKIKMHSCMKKKYVIMLNASLTHQNQDKCYVRVIDYAALSLAMPSAYNNYMICNGIFIMTIDLLYERKLMDAVYYIHCNVYYYEHHDRNC